jgi:hypothetical protein
MNRLGPGRASVPAPVPYRLSVSDSDLDDLRRRLTNARYAPDFANADWRYGTNGDYLRELVQYWIGGYDWRGWERYIISINNYLVEFDGVPVHFIYEPGAGPNPMPIVLTHGWPWTFFDYVDAANMLSDPGSVGADPRDSFDVTLPSLPGFGPSGPWLVPVSTPSPPPACGCGWHVRCSATTVSRQLAVTGAPSLARLPWPCSRRQALRHPSLDGLVEDLAPGLAGRRDACVRRPASTIF